MKILAKFLGGLLILALSSAILFTCLDFTLLKANFVVAQADKTTIYQNIATQLSDGLANQNGVTDPELKQQLGSVITPDYVRAKLMTYLQALEQSYRKGLTPPQLNLSDLPSKLAATGVVLPPDQQAQLNQQINQQVGSGSKQPALGKVYHTGMATKLGLWLAAVVLAGLLAAVSPAGKRLVALAKALFGSAVMLGIYYGLLRYLPHFVAGRLASSGDNPLLGSVNQLVAAASAGVAGAILRWIIGLVAVGAALLIAEPFLRRHFKSQAPAKKGEQKRTPLPLLRRKEN